MLAMVALGFGEIAGALITGYIVDKFGAKRSSFLNAGYVLMATLFVMNLLYLNSYSVWAYVVTFMWGFQDSSISIHLNSILGFEFASNKEPYSIDALVEAIMVFTFQVIQSRIRSVNAHFMYMTFVGLCGIAMTLTTYFFDYTEPKELLAMHTVSESTIGLTALSPADHHPKEEMEGA